jgi:hypothetical protein
MMCVRGTKESAKKQFVSHGDAVSVSDSVVVHMRGSSNRRAAS